MSSNINYRVNDIVIYEDGHLLIIGKVTKEFRNHIRADWHLVSNGDIFGRDLSCNSNSKYLSLLYRFEVKIENLWE